MAWEALYHWIILVSEPAMGITFKWIQIQNIYADPVGLGPATCVLYCEIHALRAIKVNCMQ